MSRSGATAFQTWNPNDKKNPNVFYPISAFCGLWQSSYPITTFGFFLSLGLHMSQFLLDRPYAIILCYKKYKRPAMNIGENISVNSGQFQEGKVEEISRKLDKWMMIAYPYSFIIFTAIFWSTII